MTDRNAAAAMDKSGKPGERKLEDGKGKDREREGNGESAHKSPNKKRRKVNHGMQTPSPTTLFSIQSPEIVSCWDSKIWTRTRPRGVPRERYMNLRLTRAFLQLVYIADDL